MDAPPVTRAEMDGAARLVKRQFGHAELRAGQAEVIARVHRGEDVLGILPTGGGKSVCYQVVPAFTEGVTLVVSPLLALMKDQLDSLPPHMRGVAASLTSELTAASQRRLLDDVARGGVRLLYVAPERLRRPALLRALARAGVARLVVDEAHCVSVWGHDFRPDYLGIAEARRALGMPPILALTATAPPRVERDIQDRIGPLVVVRAGVHRPNLRLEAVEARDADEKLRHLLRLALETQGPGVVYASSRAKCEQIAAALAREGIRAEPYHAGLPDRAARQEAFMRGDTDVLVATVAFGMGVDKQDVRFIFHHDPSSSLENYYQEAGRAGRDGRDARCVVLASRQDPTTLKQRAKGDLPSRALVEAVWKLVVMGLGEDRHAFVDKDQLDALDPDDDVKPPVALSILEQAGALARVGDAPRFLLVQARAGPLASVSGREASLFDVAAALGVPPGEVEERLVALEEEGALTWRPTARATLYRVDGDTSRVEAVLERYAARAVERGDEMIAYVRDGGCRHAHIRRFFGETDAPDKCESCDNCLGLRHLPLEQSKEDEESAARAVLGALAGMRGLGETNLVHMLRGDYQAADWLHGRPGFGQLAFRSVARVRQLVRDLEARGLLARETLPHGGAALRLSASGEAALGSARPLLPAAPAPAASRPAAAEAAPLSDEGEALFARLKAWRRERADAEGVPPYVVAPDAALREVARANPASPADLLAVKGFGPKRVEKYGQDILRVLGP